MFVQQRIPVYTESWPINCNKIVHRKINVVHVNLKPLSKKRFVFPAAPYLPKDDGEFYQFCYVSGKGYVRGASTPFQFKKPQTDDYIEVEEDDMMMVKPATTVLLESLNAATTERTKLEKVIVA